MTTATTAPAAATVIPVNIVFPPFGLLLSFTVSLVYHTDLCNFFARNYYASYGFHSL